MERTRKTALPQSRSHPGNLRPVDQQIRTLAAAQPRGSQKASRRKRRGENMSAEKFVYVIYIRTTVEKLWDALTKPAFTQSYWCGCRLESAWEAGSPWKLMIPDGRVGD